MRKFILLNIVLLCFFLSGCAYYNFGVAVEEYPNIFNGAASSKKQGNDKYSFNTFLDIEEYTALIHHGSLLSGSAVKKRGNNLKMVAESGEMYIWYSVRMYDYEGVRISVNHLFSGIEMEPVGAFIKRLSTFTSESYSPYSGGIIEDGKPFVFVKIYKLPVGDKHVLSGWKSEWFNGGIEENLTIETKDGSVYCYEFKSRWHKAGDIWNILGGV